MATAHSDQLFSRLRDASSTPHFNTAAVVRLTEVPAATFRAWERRYGYPMPQRLPGGQRLYSELDVVAIRWLHEQTERGLTISRAIAHLRRVVVELQAPSSPAATGRPTGSFVPELAAALLAGDQVQADRILAEAFALYSIETVALEVVQPLLVEIGERWHAGTLTVSEEHLTTQYILRKLFGLLNAYDPARGHGLVLTACAPGEWHEVGALMLSLFLVRRGYRVLYLGPNLPLEQLPNHLEQLSPDAVCLSATMPESAEAVMGAAAALRSANGQGPLITFGGQAFADNSAIQAESLEGYLAGDARAAVEHLERLLSQNGRG
jgi:methanogenic corrinoid protein MtbC1